MRVLLLGDSHLANLDLHHVNRLERELGATVDNAAFGGAWSGDLQNQVGHRDLGSFDVVLLSIGTNDAHPAYASSIDTLRGNLRSVIGGVPRVVLLLSPGVHHAPAPFDTDDVNTAIDAYVAAAAAIVSEMRGVVVTTKWVLDELESRAWSPDGLHLSDTAYERVIPTLITALRPQTG